MLLSDPSALHAFDDNDVVLPIIVLTELESKRHHPELGWAARTSLRSLEELRERHGEMTTALPLGDNGGTVRVELNHKDDDVIPEPLRGASNDHRILTVAAHVRAEGRDVVLVTQDLPMRLRAGVLGIHAVEFRHTNEDLDWRGVIEVEVVPDGQGTGFATVTLDNVTFVDPVSGQQRTLPLLDMATLFVGWLAG